MFIYPKGKNRLDFHNNHCLFRREFVLICTDGDNGTFYSKTKVKLLRKIYIKLVKCGSVCLSAYELLLGGHFYDLAT